VSESHPSLGARSRGLAEEQGDGLGGIRGSGHVWGSRHRSGTRRDTDVHLGEFTRLGAATVPAGLAASTLMLWRGAKAGP
jgi:hypothetical protein